MAENINQLRLYSARKATAKIAVIPKAGAKDAGSIEALYALGELFSYTDWAINYEVGRVISKYERTTACDDLMTTMGSFLWSCLRVRGGFFPVSQSGCPSQRCRAVRLPAAAGIFCSNAPFIDI